MSPTHTNTAGYWFAVITSELLFLFLLMGYKHLLGLIFIITRAGDVLGSYRVEVTVHSYQNPTGRCVECQSGPQAGCCDENFIRSAEEICPINNCDPGLSYCVRPIGEQCEADDVIPSRQMLINTNSIDFDSLGSLLGLDNPVIVEEEEPWNGIEFILTSWDCTSPTCSSFSRIDNVIVTIDVPVDTERPELTYSGVADIAEFVVSFAVRCADGYYGGDCTTECTDFVSCEGCGLDGYTGLFCHRLTHDCNEEYCNGNGECVDGRSVCACDPGFTGERCEGSQFEAAIAGGVVGGVVGIVIIIVVIVVITVLWKRGRVCAATKQNDEINSGDNPAYGVRNTVQNVEEREFNNPIYSSDPLEEGDADDDPYTVPDSPPSNVYDRVPDATPSHVSTGTDNDHDTAYSTIKM